MKRIAFFLFFASPILAMTSTHWWVESNFCSNELVGKPKYFRGEKQILSESGLPPSLRSVDAKPAKQGGFFYNVTDLVPSSVRFFHGKQAYEVGADCREFACYLTGAIQSISGGMIESEFAYWIQTSKYRKLTSTESPRPGDLVTIREKGAIVEVHSAVYVSPRLLFSKNGIAYEEPYLLQSAEEVFRKYMGSLPKSCLAPGFWAKPECKKFIELYRPVDLVMSSTPFAISNSIKDLQRHEKIMTMKWIEQEMPSRDEMKEIYNFVESESKRAMQTISELEANGEGDTNAALIQYWKIHWARVSHLNPSHLLAPWVVKKPLR